VTFILHIMIAAGGQLPNPRERRLFHAKEMKEAEIREPVIPPPIRSLARRW